MGKNVLKKLGTFIAMFCGVMLYIFVALLILLFTVNHFQHPVGYANLSRFDNSSKYDMQADYTRDDVKMASFKLYNKVGIQLYEVSITIGEDEINQFESESEVVDYLIDYADTVVGDRYGLYLLSMSVEDQRRFLVRDRLYLASGADEVFTPEVWEIFNQCCDWCFNSAWAPASYEAVVSLFIDHTVHALRTRYVEYTKVGMEVIFLCLPVLALVLRSHRRKKAKIDEQQENMLPAKTDYNWRERY